MRVVLRRALYADPAAHADDLRRRAVTTLGDVEQIARARARWRATARESNSICLLMQGGSGVP